MAVPSPMGTARTRAMAVVSTVPRMNGSSPYLPWDGAHTFPTIQEKPSVEKAGLDWTMIDTTYQATSPTKIAAMAIRMP